MFPFMPLASQLKKFAIQGLVGVIRPIPFINRAIYGFSRAYIDGYRYFTYDFTINGEKALIEKVATHFGDRFVFLDVGANVGDWTNFIASRFSHFSGHLFEMSEATYKNLEKRFGNDKRITLNKMAVSDKDGTIEYRFYGENFGSNTTLQQSSYFKRPSEILTAAAITGDSYCSRNNIKHVNFLKIDTEGADFSVISGFESYFHDKKVDIVQFEYGYTNGDVGIVMRNFFDFFQARGYIVGRLEPKGVRFKEFEYTDNDFKSGPNYVACLPEFRQLLEKF